jgi:hypothetical protein
MRTTNRAAGCDVDRVSRSVDTVCCLYWPQVWCQLLNANTSRFAGSPQSWPGRDAGHLPTLHGSMALYSEPVESCFELFVVAKLV